MWRLRLVPDNTAIEFIRRRLVFFVLSALLGLGSVTLYLTNGLNFGIDFAGGILIEVKTPAPANLAQMRATLGDLGLGEVQLQEFGAVDDVLIRVERQPGDAAAQNVAVLLVKDALADALGDGVDYRRVEFVGPKVGGELIRAGVLAVLFSVLAMLVYIWFRFELPFGIGAVIALIHDVVLTVGMFALIGLEFNLAIVAALLLIIGYSMNDTVVVYDRVRENLRKYKSLPLIDILNKSINGTLARTVMTSATTLLALLALFIFGGEVIRGFCFAMIWGVIVGTYSSIFIATPLLLYLKPRQSGRGGAKDAEGGGSSPPAEAAPKPKPKPKPKPNRRRTDRRAGYAAVDITPLIPAGRQVIEGYGPGGFTISGVRLTGSLLVFPEQTLAWSATDATHLDAAAFDPVIAAEPAVEILLFGCGATGHRPAPDIAAPLRDAGITLECMDTGAACRTYNVLMAVDRRVAAALLALGRD